MILPLLLLELKVLVHFSTTTVVAPLVALVRVLRSVPVANQSDT